MNGSNMSIWDRYVPDRMVHRPTGIGEEDWQWQLRCGRDMILRGRAETEFIPEHKRRAMEALEVARAAVRERQRLAAEERAAEAARLEALRWKFPAGLDLHLRGLAAQEANGVGQFAVVTDRMDFHGYCYLQLVKYEHAREVGELLGPNPTFARLFGISSSYFKTWSVLMAYGCEKVDDTRYHIGYGVEGSAFYEVLMICVQRKGDHLVFSKGSLGRLAEDTRGRSDCVGPSVRSGFTVGMEDTVGGAAVSRLVGQDFALQSPDGTFLTYPGDSIGIVDLAPHFGFGGNVSLIGLAGPRNDEKGRRCYGRRVTIGVPDGPEVEWGGYDLGVHAV